ncbi:MAG: hypothetical protein R6U70_00450 [Bacillota bacterium]
MYYITAESNRPIPREAPLWELVRENPSYTVASETPLVVRCPTPGSMRALIAAARCTNCVRRLKVSGRRPSWLAHGSGSTVAGERRVAIENGISQMQSMGAAMQYTMQIM